MALLSVVAVILSIIALKNSTDVLERLEKLEKKNSQSVDTKPSHIHNQETSLSENKILYANSTTIDSSEHHNQQQNSIASSAQLKAQNSTQSIHKITIDEVKESAFIVWLKEDWLLKLGGVLVVMGVLFFLSIAFTYIGEAGKIATGYLFGISFMIFGFMYAKKKIAAGFSVHLVGAVIIIISSYVAHQPNFNVFNSYVAMVMMFFTAACIALTAFTYKQAQLAHVGLFVASLVPVLTQSPQSTFFEVLMYLAVVIAGVIWLAFVTQWRSLVLMSILIVIIYSIVFISEATAGSVLLGKELFMVSAFGVLFFITSLFSILRSGGKFIKYDGIVALLNAGYALLWIINQAQPELASILIATVGLIYAVGFFFVYRITNVFASFLVYGGVALGMLTTAIMLEISGRSLTVILLLMGAGVSFFTHYLSKEERITKIMSFFNILPMLYVLKTINTIASLPYPEAGLVDAWKDLLIISLAVVIYISLYNYFSTRVKSIGLVALWTAVLLVVDLVWQIMYLITTKDYAMQISMLATCAGLTMFVYRISENKSNTEKIAFINICSLFVILKPLFLLDTWKDWSAVAFSLSIAIFMYYFFINRVKTVGLAALAASLLLIAASVWQVSHIVIPSEGLASFVSILIFTIVGLYNLWTGSLNNNDVKVKISRVWLGFVAARVIIFDAWQSGNVAVGVLICIVTGILLLSSAFIIKKATTENH